MHPETGTTEYEELRKQAFIFLFAMIFCGASALTLAPSILRGSAPSRVRLVPSSWRTSPTSRASLLRSNTPLPFEHFDVVTDDDAQVVAWSEAGDVLLRVLRGDPRQEGAHRHGCLSSNHQIGALAAQLQEVNTPEFVEYSKDVVSNAGTLAEALIAKGAQARQWQN